jgi:pyruvate dehydrogenase E2 component (dihydrolipoamide acetyltransferase)
MVDVIMPKMGDAMTEGRVLRWIKQPGEAVKKGEPLAEIETDKVNVDLESEEDGTLAEILVPDGEVAVVGAPIARLAGPGEDATAAKPPRVKRAPAADTGAAEPVRASPLARRLAAEYGIPLSSIPGTGPDGRITKEDVETAHAGQRRAAAEPAPRPAAAVLPPAAAAGDVPLSRMRQTISRRMTDSKQRAPHIYLTVSIDMDAALALRRQLNDGAPDDAKISVNDMVVRAAALALRKVPALNATFTGEAIRHNADVNISIGIALPDGLIAPTVYHCDRKSLWEIAADARALAERARAGRLRAEDLTGGTFTISNLGMFGVEVFSAIINPPQAAILAIGAARPQPVVRDGQIVAATIMQVTCSADHRVTDGAEVANYLAELKRLLEHPVWLVAVPPAAGRADARAV